MGGTNRASSASGLVVFAALVATLSLLLETTAQQPDNAAAGVATHDTCEPGRILPAYMQQACNLLLASYSTAQSAMSASGTGSSPPDRRPLSDPPRYGRRSGGPSQLTVNHDPISFFATKRLHSAPTHKPYDAARSSGRKRLFRESYNLLQQIAKIRYEIATLDDM